jgi:hypothetical protein
MISFRLSSSSIFAVAALSLFAACTGPVVIASGTGGATTTTSTTTTPTTTATTTTGTGGGNACTEAGGTCEFSGQTCTGTTGPEGSCGASVGAFCCIPADPCANPCPVEMLGQTQCAGSSIQTCKVAGNCSIWETTSACPSGESCNSDGTKCVAPTLVCSTAADCGCFCTCTPQGMCGDCTGAVPTMCTSDSECGPVCSGYHCVSGTCQM